MKLHQEPVNSKSKIEMIFILNLTFYVLFQFMHLNMKCYFMLPHKMLQE